MSRQSNNLNRIEFIAFAIFFILLGMGFMIILLSIDLQNHNKFYTEGFQDGQANCTSERELNYSILNNYTILQNNEEVILFNKTCIYDVSYSYSVGCVRK